MAKAWKFPERMSRLWYFVLVLIFVPLLLAVTYQFVDGVRSKSASANGGGVFAFAGPILIGLKMRLRDAGTPSWISILLLVVGGLLVVAMQMLPMMRLDWIVAHGLSRTTWQLMTPECVGAFGVLTAMVLGAGVLPPSQPVAPEAAAPVAPDSGRGPVLMDPALLPLQASPGPLSSVPPPAGSEALRLSWSQPPGMVALSFKNFLLKIVTLGIYQFWGKTEVRRRIWSAIRINGEPLQYTGTGKEMFLGFLVVLAILTIPSLLVSLGAMIVFGPKSRAPDIFRGIFTLFIFFLIGVGAHKASRYRLTRTNWRGIRGGLEGSSWSYGGWYFGTGVLLVLTLGWISPWRSAKLQSFITNGMRFGNRPFQFDAKSGPLYGPFAVLWFSAIGIAALIGAILTASFAGLADLGSMHRDGRTMDPRLLFFIIAVVYGAFIVGFLLFGIVSAWYRARMMNHFAAHTTFEGARFSGSATGRSLIWLTITNTLMVLFTLGLLSPVAQARAARYFVEHMQIEGGASLAQILQRAEDANKRGEGLAQAFDIDAF